jgi:acetyltransferase-like isoleucine patch superfamily enzyme
VPITIGDNTLIGAYSYIVSANHRFESRAAPIRDQGYRGAPIEIGEDVWIGTHVVILPGVRIGKGAIIGAGSLVNRNIPEYEIWGGVPARFIKKRPL